ncbi:MAG: alpha-L-fucosidase, partial [Ruminococcus sp.]|nr:alpha-L-fucosidase [Ruminococcus sp.]
QNVSRNGSLLLNITQRGRGNIDPEARQICEDIGRWPNKYYAEYLRSRCTTDKRKGFIYHCQSA